LSTAGARKDFGPLLLSGPCLGFGGWAVGGTAWGAATDVAERLGAIQLAFDRGITFFDTAPTYGDGESERLLGQALRPVRDRVVIATKVGPRDDPRASLARSLERLGTDYVDLVQLHETGPDWERQIERLSALKDDGLARAIGLCNASARQLQRAAELAPLASFQAAYNLFDRDVESRTLAVCRERGLAFLAYRPLAAGLLSGKFDQPPAFPPDDHRERIYWFRGREFERRGAVIARLRPLAERLGLALPVLALRWLLAQAGVTVVLAGARSRAQVDQNLAAMEGPLPAAAVTEIDRLVAEAFRLPRATPAAREQAAGWGVRERFIVERLDGTHTAETIAAEWSERDDPPMVAAQVKVFADQLRASGLAGV
jgi:aryl-alcohol dehydrogenase-like predicted oxidoreductase